MIIRQKIRLIQNFQIIFTLTLTILFILIYACEKIEHEKILKITTGEITDTTTTTATANGGAPVTTRGVCWSSSQNPTIADAFITDGSGTGSFASSITGLTPNTTYYVKAYVTNSAGTGYGNEIIFKTYSMLNDSRDGQEYKTTEIGEQWWMAGNLNFYTSSGSWYYDNDSTTHSETYGRLYTWETAKNVCPDGWHLPTDSEWKELEIFLGMTQAQADNTGWRGTDQGVQLSIDGDSRFEALFAGYRFYTGAFYDLGTSAYFWNSTEASGDFAWCRFITAEEYTGVNRSGFLKESSFSVRCVQNEL